MPSTTFFNLPQAKRDRLLQAAREEFARVPYDQVSINKIVQAAEIPRGSFYMYFTNKEDLFLYMTEEFTRSLFQMLQRLLEQAEGDPFRAFLSLYDYVAQYSPPNGMEKLLQLFCRSLKWRQGLPCVPARLDSWAEGLVEHVDWSRLRVEREEDKQDILHILFTVMAPALGDAAFCLGSQEARQRLVARLEILKRGMQAPANTNYICKKEI